MAKEASAQNTSMGKLEHGHNETGESTNDKPYYLSKDRLPNEHVLDQVMYLTTPFTPPQNAHRLSNEVKRPLIDLLVQWNNRIDERWNRPHGQLNEWPCIQHTRMEATDTGSRDRAGFACDQCAERGLFCIRARGYKPVPLLVPLAPVLRRHPYINNPHDIRYWIQPGVKGEQTKSEGRPNEGKVKVVVEPKWLRLN